MAKSSAELAREIERLQNELKATRKKEISTHVAEIRRIMKRHSITARDLGFFEPQSVRQPKGVAKKKSPLPAKYRHPSDPKITWSGFGRMPAWAIDAKRGGALNELLIQTSAGEAVKNVSPPSAPPRKTVVPKKKKAAAQPKKVVRQAASKA